MPDTPADSELVAAFLHGEERAFEDIYRRYASLVFAVAMRSLGDRSQAEEVVSNVFGLASVRLAGLRDPSKLRAWLLAVAASEVSHLLRSVIRERRRRERVASLRVDEAVNPNDEEAEYAKGVLELARKSLSGDDQVLLGLVLAEISGPELADALGIDLGAANTRKSRLYDRLRSTVEVYWVSRPRRDRCSDLEALLAKRTDPGLTRATCRAIERHWRECPICDKERRRVDPLALLALAPLPAFSPHLEVGLLRGHRVDTQAIRGWREDGFPRRRHALRPAPKRMAAAGVVALAIAGSIVGLTVSAHAPRNRPLGSERLAVNVPTTRPTATASTATPTTTGPSGTTTSTVLSTSSTNAPAGSASGAVALPPSTAHTQAKTSAPAVVVHHKTHAKHHVPILTTTATTTATTTTTTTTTPAPGFVIDSPSVDLGTSAISAAVTFHGVGGPINWSAAPSVSWVSVQPESGTLTPNTAGGLTLSIDRSSAPTGDLQATIVITTSAGTGDVSVTAVELAPPTLSALSASPSSVTCSQSSTASASVSAPAGVRSVILSYSGGGSAGGSEPMTASGSVYSASLTPASCRAGSITWSVTATDDDGKSTTSQGPPIPVYA